MNNSAQASSSATNQQWACVAANNPKFRKSLDIDANQNYSLESSHGTFARGELCSVCKWAHDDDITTMLRKSSDSVNFIL
jgi:hypothetical protein